MGGGGGVQFSSKGGFTQAGIAPDDVQVDVGAVVRGPVVVIVGAVVGLEGPVVGCIAAPTAPTALLPTIPPMPPTISKTISFSILV